MITSISKELNPITLNHHRGEVSMLPFKLDNLDELPAKFRETVKQMIEFLPIKKGIAYLTVHGKFVKESKTLRRGGAHIDGNYLPDKSKWGNDGGWKIGENGPATNTTFHKQSYESNTGGMIIASNYSSCMGWNGQFEGTPNVGGDCTHIDLGKGFMLKPNIVYYGNSQFIHESLPVKQDVFRLMYRITLPQNYQPLNL